MIRNKKSRVLFIAALLVLFSILAVTDRQSHYYPLVEIGVLPDGGQPAQPKTPAATTGINPLVDGLKITFLFDNRSTLESCEAFTGNISRIALANCPTCVVRKLQCLQSLDTKQQEMFSDRPLDTASGRMTTGVVVYSSANPAIALATCQEAQNQSVSSQQQVTCHAPHTPRPRPTPKPIDLTQTGIALFLMCAAIFGAWFACWIILKYEHLHAHLSHDHTDTGPQKFHTEPTPRIGGIGIAAGLLTAGGLLMLANQLSYQREYGLLLVAGIPAFLGGLVEDITKKVSVLERLLLTMLSGAVAAGLLGAVLPRLDVPGLDQAMLLPLIAIGFTIFAVGGIANAINIIDGYNGLAGGFAVIALTAMAYVAYLVGDSFVFTAALILAGSLFGFLCWNWPSGKIFLGDGGAYLLGFLLAELSVLLVGHNPKVSPWFPLLLLIYPVFETVFSIYRKKYLRGHSPGKPDGLHFHMLIYKRIVPRETQPGQTFSQLERNSRVAKYFWVPTLAIAVFGGVFWESTLSLIIVAIGYSAFYVASYRRITHLKMKPIKFGPKIRMGNDL